MKSLAKIFELVTLAIAIPVVCLLPFQRIWQPGIEQLSVATVIHASAIQRMAQAETDAAANGAPQDTPIPRVIRDIEKEGHRVPASEVRRSNQVPQTLPNVSVPPIHGLDEPPPGYPNYYAPAPLNRANTYPRNVQPADTDASSDAETAPQDSPIVGEARGVGREGHRVGDDEEGFARKLNQPDMHPQNVNAEPAAPGD